MATPLINQLRVSGGTMYAFSSAVKDMQKSLMDNDIVFSFSKFALLDLPNVDLPTDGSTTENKIVWEALSTSTLHENNDLNIAESFQNYLLNHETFVLNKTNSTGGQYDNSLLQTTSERLFWKWLTKINAIKFKDASSETSTISNRYEELSSIDYTNVVKYLGDIDVINNNTEYTEVYLHVPSNHGNTPNVLFKTIQDSNYKPSLEWIATTNPNWIDGRDDNSVHPSGLSLEAFYDVDSKYEAGTTFGLTTNSEINAAGVTFSISNMDGAVIDFDETSYTRINPQLGISTLGDFNASENSGNFKFNVALIYYNIYRQSNPTVKFRNLYGMLVLDNYTNGIEFAELKRFDKFKANPLTGLNGNAYSLKFNMKIDTSVANLGVEKIINDYNTFSLDLFSDAMMQLKRASGTFEKQSLELIDIKTRLTNLENFYFSQDDLNSLSNRLLSLEKSVAAASMSFSDKKSLLNLINVNADNINSILSGNLSLNLSYNTDILFAKDGIELDKSIKNKIYIKNKVQQYNVDVYCKNDNLENTLSFESGNGVYTDSTKGNVLVLGDFTNYYKYYYSNQTLTTDLIINLDDSISKWKKGKVFKLYFNKSINLNNYIITFKTDAVNGYTKTIGSVDENLLFSNYPIIEIICTDSDSSNLQFDINILR